MTSLGAGLDQYSCYPEGVSTLKEVVDWAARQTGRQVVFVEPILEYEIAGEVLTRLRLVQLMLRQI